MIFGRCLWNIKCVFWFSVQLSTETYLILKRIQQDIIINPLTPNVNYSCRTAPLTSKVAFYIFIQQIQVLSILNIAYFLRFLSSKCSLFHNSNIFGSCIIHILYTGCGKIKKNNSCAKMLKHTSLQVKYPLFLSDFYQNWIFLIDFQTTIQHKIFYFKIYFVKICPVETESFHTDGWTDMTKLIVTVHSFVNAPTKHLAILKLPAQ